MAAILLIEDNTEIRENAVELLELAGYEVIAATDGEDGLARVKQHHVDVIVCDIMMPGADGYEVLRQLKADSGSAQIPFIYLTASAEPSEVRRGMELGADAYIRKPFEEEELLSAIGHCLKKL